jgi:hypothetical protein
MRGGSPRAVAVQLTREIQPMISIADRRELFVDRFLIDRLDNVRHILHHPVPQNIVLHHDAPWEGRSSAYGVVFQDGDRCRMYYRGGPRDEADQKQKDGIRCCYAESRDGITWEKPNLGLCEFQGSRANNILFIGESAASFAPFIDTRPGVQPEERYKALGPCGSEAQPGKIVMHAFSSADGLHWKKMQAEPVLTKGGFDSLNVAFWSEAENGYVSYFRVYSKSPDWKQFLGRRTIARAVSPDFLNWSDPVMMEFGDMRTDELYTNATLPYFRAPHLYVAFPKRYVLGRKTPLTEAQIRQFEIGPGQTFISEGVFMSSRGGNRYDRTFMEAFFRPGPDPANWCSRNNMAAWGLLQTGPAELSLYYSQHYSQPNVHLRRATLRLDGFASINAGYGGGELVTRPFLFSGSSLELNMATSGVGSIRVEIQDADGKPFKDYGVEDSYDLYGDDVARLVKWQGSPDVSKLAGIPIRLRVVMKDADLYALKFS